MKAINKIFMYLFLALGITSIISVFCGAVGQIIMAALSFFMAIVLYLEERSKTRSQKPVRSTYKEKVKMLERSCNLTNKK